MKFFLYLLCIPLLFLSCQHVSKGGSWKVAFQNDKEGNPLAGSKEELIQHIREGADLKIYWKSTGKTHSIEHLSVPIWLAILDEKEVIAHLDPQVLSKIDWEQLSASYKDTEALTEEWRVVLTTQGEFDAVWYDRGADTLIKRNPQKHIISWLVNDP